MSRSSNTHNYDYISACSFSTAHPHQFSLAIRQQPIQTRTSTNSERDRRAIDPPPIVQISLNNATPNETLEFLQNPYYFMCANLAHPNDDDEIYTPNHNALSGQTVSSMYKLKDIDNNDCGFFVLGDLSVKVEGQFRLKLTLFKITLNGAVSLKSIFTDAFTVYSAKSFPGVLDSTFLSRSFSDQGARIRIRKEHRNQITATRKRKMSISNDEYHNRPTPTPSLPAAAPKMPTLIHAPIILQQQDNASARIYAVGPTDAYTSYQRIRNHPSPSDRRASLNSIETESTCLSDDRHTSSISSTPVSPPHQSYDKSVEFPRPTCIISECSTPSYSTIPSPPWTKQSLSSHNKHMIRLPPLSQLICPENNRYVQNSNGGEQVDAAVAMVQLSQHTHQRTW